MAFAVFSQPLRPLNQGFQTSVETYAQTGRVLLRRIARTGGSVCESKIVRTHRTLGEADLLRAFQKEWLASKTRPADTTTSSELVYIDLFSGCGGLSLGVEEAARALGFRARPALAVDIDEAALGVFERNLHPASAEAVPIESFVNGELGDPPTAVERRVGARFGGVDLLVGGPPCQGHSNLNNRTRRADPKNELYLRVVRFAEVTRAGAVLIENVPAVLYDRTNVVGRALAHLRWLGYFVTHGVIAADVVGVPQRRQRHFLIASRSRLFDLNEATEGFRAEAPPVVWAIDDLPDSDGAMYDTASVPSEDNRRRIDYLFDNSLYDLPNAQRPDCHRLKPHRYQSVYGRMFPDKPAPTLTSGFGSMGQGRFVHPTERRTLTPHEAARLQGFPDWFDFSGVKGRMSLHVMIGNAVPSRLALAVVATLLR